MRQHLTFFVQLVALLTQVTHSSATPRFFGQHGQIAPHPSFSFGFPFGGFPTDTSLSPTTTSTELKTSTPTPIQTKPVQSQTFQNAVQVSSHDAISSLSHVASISDKPSSVTQSHSSVYDASSRAASSFPASSTSSTAEESTFSLQTSALPVASTTSSKSNKLIEIVVPVVLAVLIACAITVAFFRYRRFRNKKDWEGSHLPELDGKPGIWAFGRSDTASTTKPRDTYAGSGDWNRSDAHLRGEVDYREKDDALSLESSGATTDPIPASDQDDVTEHGHSEVGHISELGHSEIGHSYVRAFHSESPLHDEPALAESASRPGTLLRPLPLPPLPPHAA